MSTDTEYGQTDIPKISRIGTGSIYSHDYTYPKKIPAFDTHSTYGVDVKFVNPDIGDYRLQKDSPAIGAGDPALTSASGKQKNIGAYQGDEPDADWMLRCDAAPI